MVHVNDNAKLTVVIVSYNSIDTIQGTLEPLLPLFKEGYLEVVVVDNHGEDGVCGLLTTDYNWVHLVCMEQNLGFGYGCNKGFKAVDAEYTLFLNPDAVIDANSIRQLISFMDRNLNAAATAPCIIEDGELQLAGLLPEPLSLINHNSKGNPRPIKPSEHAFRTNWLCGAVMLVRSRCFAEIGGFDEKFFLYFEETDLCKRFSKAGYDMWANGQSIAMHVGGGSVDRKKTLMVSGCIAEHYYRSRFLYFKKHYGMFHAISNNFLELSVLFMRAVKGVLSGNQSAIDTLKTRVKVVLHLYN